MNLYKRIYPVWPGKKQQQQQQGSNDVKSGDVEMMDTAAASNSKSVHFNDANNAVGERDMYAMD
jgi:hypothetical protein